MVVVIQNMGGGRRRGNKCVSATRHSLTGRRAVVVKAQQALSLIAYCRVTTAPRRPQFFRIQVTLRFSATLGPRETIQEEGPPTDRPTNRYGEGIPTDRPCNRYGGGTLWFDNSNHLLATSPSLLPPPCRTKNMTSGLPSAATAARPRTKAVQAQHIE